MCVLFQPFKSRGGHYSGRHFFGRKSPGAVARAVQTIYGFGKSSSFDFKKLFDLGLGFSLGDVTKRVCVCV